MSQKIQEIPKHVEAGRLLSERLRIARELSGPTVCPACKARFDATHVMKCPECRTFIDDTFQADGPGKREKNRPRKTKRRSKNPPGKTCLAQRVKEKVELELDFFTQGYMKYKG